MSTSPSLDMLMELSDLSSSQETIVDPSSNNEERWEVVAAWCDQNRENKINWLDFDENDHPCWRKEPEQRKIIYEGELTVGQLINGLLKYEQEEIRENKSKLRKLKSHLRTRSAERQFY